MFMKCVLSLALLTGLSLTARAQQPQTAPESDVKRVTLYGPLAHGHDNSRAFFSFKTGTYGLRGDLGYGSLYVSEEYDWFQVSTAQGARTAFRDLGAHDWADSFGVPYVEPFPVLKEGERRQIVVNADGADGKPGRSAGPGGNAEDNIMRPPLAPGYFPSFRAEDNPSTMSYAEELKPSPKLAAPGPRRDGVPKVDPIFARAIPGHIYVIHVVDDVEDFYVLFRVESLVRGDNCTISWKRVPAPEVKTAGKH